MHFNLSKCVAMLINSSKNVRKSIYSLHNVILYKLNQAKYLGITIDNKISWNSHVDSITLKGSRSLGLVRRNLRPALRKTREQAYKRLVRPHLEFASSAWDPHTDRNIDKLEMVQRRGAMFVTGRYDNTSSVGEMLSLLNWQTLQYRRRVARVTLLYKALNDLVTPN